MKSIRLWKRLIKRFSKEKDEGSNMVMNAIISIVMVVVMIFVVSALWSPTMSNVHTIQTDNNTPTNAQSIWGNVPVMLAIGILIAIIGAVVIATLYASFKE